MRLHAILPLGFVLLAFLGCGQVQTEPAPPWVERAGTDPATYPSARFLTGYGVSAAGGSVAEQREQALGMARAALASGIRTRISAEYTSRVTQKDQRMSRLVENRVRTEALVELDGLDTFQVWPDPGKHVTHVLAVLDKGRTLQIMGDRVARTARECADAFEAARRAGDAQGLLAAWRIRQGLEEALVVQSALGGGAALPACPGGADIRQELRRVYSERPGLDGLVAAAALDLGSGLPKGVRVLMDRVTYADTPFCGSFSAFMEQALAAELVNIGQVKILDKAAGRLAISTGGMGTDLAASLGSQAVVRGTCFDLGGEIQVNLKITATDGDELAATTVRIPAARLRQAGLKLVPDNYEDARKNLEICNAQAQASTLKVKLALDRGEGGIYRRGEKLYLFLKANQDCYVKVIYHQVDGSNIQIFPNDFHPDARIRKDQLYQIPPDDHSFEMEVLAPFGVEMVKVIASTEPLGGADPAPHPAGLKVVPESLATLLGQTRAIKVKKAEAQYAEDTAVVNTMDAL